MVTGGLTVKVMLSYFKWFVFVSACSTNMEDLREKTHTQHYELYRQKRLQEMGFADLSADNRPVRYLEGGSLP